MKEIKPPEDVNFETLWSKGKYTVFLAGSIEMNTAEDWQSELKKELSELDDLILLNPRRDNWDSSWKQTKDSPEFRGQVLWELDCQEKAHSIVMYFDENTKSPITLLELGLFARNYNLIVCCPTKFWRKGNVDIVCEKYNIKQTESLKGLGDYIRNQYKLFKSIKK